MKQIAQANQLNKTKDETGEGGEIRKAIEGQVILNLTFLCIGGHLPTDGTCLIIRFINSIEKKPMLLHSLVRACSPTAASASDKSIISPTAAC